MAVPVSGANEGTPEPEQVNWEQAREPELVLAARTAAVDRIVGEAVSSELSSPDLPSFSLCAVGGYGRGELFPYSDVDLLIVTTAENDLAKLKSSLADFFRVLWDAGLRVSHSARTVAECTRLQTDNPEFQVSLLDLRYTGGDKELYALLVDRLAALADRWRAPLIRRLRQLCLTRHLKFNQTVYHLEPNVKETCGGLRDLHMLQWFGQLLPQEQNLRDALSELEGARQFLFSQRIFLHLQAKRDANLLSFDMQDLSARSLPLQPMQPEAWMRWYFGHARRVFQATQYALDAVDHQTPSLQRRWQKWRDRLSTAEFGVLRDEVWLRDPGLTFSSPANLLQLFIFCGRHGLSLSWEAQRQIRSRLAALEQAFRDSPPLWTSWQDLLRQPHAATGLEEMAKTGILALSIPEWATIDSLVVRDFYHRYTVDEHTLVTLQAVDRLTTAAGSAGGTSTVDRLLQLASEERNLPALRLALLLHDLGKGTFPGDHVQGSVETAPLVMRRLGVPPSTAASVLFLIEKHLHLSFIMNARDLEDPATARFLTRDVTTQEDLRRLTLLTYADISAVNPTAMTPWRLEQLWRVYLLGTEQLMRELSSDRIHIDTLGAGALAAASPALQSFLEGLPRRYLRTHAPDEIAHHQEMAEESRRGGVAVDIRPDGAAAGVWQLTVVTHDQPGLLAALCGVLASFGMNIVKGEASSNAAGYVLDVLRFDDPNQTLALNTEEVDRLEGTVKEVVRGATDVAALLKRRRPPKRASAESSVAPSVHFNNDASDSATLIDFSGEDRPGLLYDLTSAIHRDGCNIEVLMIDTEAHRASDVFYVTCEGRKLDEDAIDRVRHNLLQAAEES